MRDYRRGARLVLRGRHSFGVAVSMNRVAPLRTSRRLPRAATMVENSTLPNRTLPVHDSRSPRCRITYLLWRPVPLGNQSSSTHAWVTSDRRPCSTHVRCAIYLSPPTCRAGVFVARFCYDRFLPFCPRPTRCLPTFLREGWQRFLRGGSWIRTSDLRLMRPTRTT